MREICIIFFDKDGIYVDRSSDDGLIKAYNHISSNVNSKEEFDFMMKLRRVIKNRGLLYLTNKNSFSSLNLIEISIIMKLMEEYPRQVTFDEIVTDIDEKYVYEEYLLILIHKGLITKQGNKYQIVFQNNSIPYVTKSLAESPRL